MFASWKFSRFLLCLLAIAHCSSAQDVAIVFGRLHAFILGNGDCTQMASCSGPPESSCVPSIEYSAKLWPNGTWPDIDYTNQEASNWTTVQHLARTLSMARAYLTPQCTLHNSTHLISQTQLALSLWLQRDFKNPNWWWNQFGVPQYIGSITVLLLPLKILSAQEITTIDGMLLRAEGSFSGQNLVWSLQILSMRGLFQNNVTEVALNFNGIWAASSFANGQDGVQIDGSFYQHGQLLQNGAYGGDFALTLVVSVSLARATQFAMPLNTSFFLCLNTFWLDGEQYMMRNNFWDVSVKGREITRAPAGCIDVATQPLIPALASLGADESVPRYLEWAALARRLQGSEPPFVGTRHFWWNDYTVHHRPQFFISLHSTSTRTYGAECVNGEGQQSWHMGDGATFIYQDGDEYKSIFPVWDWTRIPGTTSPQASLGKPCDVKKLGKTSFVGGATDGTLGVSTLDFVGNDWSNGFPALSARKSWVWVDEGFVALIANVSFDADEHEIVTTLDQCLLQAPVVIQASGSSAVLPAGNHSLVDLKWVHHHNVVYAFLSPPPTVSVRNLNMTGTWKSINDEGSPTLVSLPTLTISMQHLVSGSSSIYAILPGVTASDAAAAVANFTSHITVVSNTVEAQSLLYEQGTPPLATLFASVFFPSNVNGGKGWNLAGFNEPCVVVVRELGPKLLRFSAANPANKPLTLSFTIDRALAFASCSPSEGSSGVVCESKPDGTSQITITMAQEQLAGSTTTGCCSLI